MPSENPVSHMSEKKQNGQRVSDDASRTFYAVAVFSLLVIVVTLWLFVYTLFQQSQIKTLETEISVIDSKSLQLEKSRDISLALLLKKTGGVAPSLNMTDIVRKFRDLAVLSNVQLQWFALENNKIHTSVVSTIGGPDPDTVGYILTMLDTYVRDTTATGQVFRMLPVYSIGGLPERRTTEIDLEFIPWGTGTLTREVPSPSVLTGVTTSGAQF